MDFVYTLFINCQSFGVMNFQQRDRNHSGFINNALFCVSNMNKSLIGLERVNDDRISIFG